MKVLKNRVKIERARNDMTQAVLAKAVGIGLNKMINLEKGRLHPDVHTCLRIAEFFSTTVDYLFYLEVKTE